ncbi:hypothetical protein D9M68_751250 [compost metagenome]
MTTSLIGARDRVIRVSRFDTRYQATHSDRPIISPGAIPARNSLVMDTLAATPNRIRPIDGGSTGAMMPDAATSPAAVALSCPTLTIIGTSKAARAAASAAAEPDRLASTQAARMVT